MVKLSKRLAAAAALVSGGARLADVGTDHGYVPIYLIQQQKISGAIAMDLRKGPLLRAEDHIRLYGLGSSIQTRLSDGVDALAPGEADSILVAGMGGGLVIHILSRGQEVCRQARELILQPQSELASVRRFLWENHYRADAEEMIFEDGKYYPMMRVRFVGDIAEETPSEWECRYGKLLLEQGHPVLKEYLERERRIQGELLARLAQTAQTPEIMRRIGEVEHTLELNERALGYW